MPTSVAGWGGEAMERKENFCLRPRTGEVIMDLFGLEDPWLVWLHRGTPSVTRLSRAPPPPQAGEEREWRAPSAFLPRVRGRWMARAERAKTEGVPPRGRSPCRTTHDGDTPGHTIRTRTKNSLLFPDFVHVRAAGNTTNAGGAGPGRTPPAARFFRRPDNFPDSREFAVPGLVRVAREHFAADEVRKGFVADAVNIGALSFCFRPSDAPQPSPNSHPPVRCWRDKALGQKQGRG